jgi:hypothetical protein
MPKTEEYTPPTGATKDELETIKKLAEFIESPHLTGWENEFLSSLERRKEEDFVLLLSKKQRAQIVRIWEKLFDLGVIV